MSPEIHGTHKCQRETHGTHKCQRETHGTHKCQLEIENTRITRATIKRLINNKMKFILYLFIYLK